MSGPLPNGLAIDSGHAGQEQYGDGDEVNDFDETLCPVGRGLPVLQV